MKLFRLSLFLFLLGFMACETTLDIDPLTCQVGMDRSDLDYILEKIDAEVFKQAKFDRGINLTQDECLYTAQVMEIVDRYTFNDDQLEMAKHLYHRTVDQSRYYDVVDMLVHLSDREELTDYIERQ